MKELINERLVMVLMQIVTLHKHFGRFQLGQDLINSRLDFIEFLLRWRNDCE